MKKVGILTFHRCINYGAYWQTRCLSEFFRQAGHEVAVLDYRSREYAMQELRHALRPFRPAPAQDLLSFAAKALKFFRAQQDMRRTPGFSLGNPPVFSDFDLIVVGSDEVWNLDHPWLGGVPLFFGERLAPRRLISYAASFGNYDAAKGLSREWVNRLGRFDRISVRDVNSRELINRHLGRAPTLVLDPCLQFTPEVAPGRAATKAAAAPYLLIYGNRFEPEVVAEARSWARSNNARIVSIGYRNDWADVSVLSAGPDDFVAAFRDATAVVTSYFHGCVFSLQFRRPFVAQLSAYRANKIAGLLGSVNAPQRVFVAENPGRLGELLSTPIEPGVLATIAGQRRESAAFLDSCLSS